MPKKVLDISSLQVRAFIMRAAGIPQTEIAERLGATQGQVAMWLKDLSDALLGMGPLKKGGNRLFDAQGHLTRIGQWLKPQLDQLDTALRNLEKQTSPNRQILGFCKPAAGLMGAVMQALSASARSRVTDGAGHLVETETLYDLVADSSRTLLKALVAGRIDVAVVTSEVLESFRTEAGHHKRVVPVVSHGGFQQKSKLFASASNADPILKRAATCLSPGDCTAFFSESRPRWIWYEPKFLPRLQSRIAQYMTDRQAPGFRISYPIHDLESLHVSLLGNRGVTIMPESVAAYRYPGISAFDLPPDFPAWEFEIVRHESNSHELIVGTCRAIQEIATSLCAPGGAAQGGAEPPCAASGTR